MDEIEKYEIGTSSLISKDKLGVSTLDRSSDLLMMYVAKTLKLPPHEQNSYKYEKVKENLKNFLITTYFMLAVDSIILALMMQL